MASRIQGITIELNGDTTKLDKALSSTNKEIKTTQSQLKDVEKLLKLDPTNINLLRQKQQLLNSAIEETNKKLATLKEAQRQMDENGVDKNSAQYQGLQREIAATEQSLASLEKQAASSNATMAQIGAVAENIANKTDELAQKTKALSAAGAALVGAIGGMALSAVKAGDELETLSKQTGFSVEELQQMQYAAEIVDVSMEDITSSAQRLKRNMGSSSSSVVEAFKKLGVSVRDSNGNLRNSTTVYWEIIEALKNVTNETERDTIAMQLLGKNADSLAGIIDDGGEAFNRLGAEAKASGLIMNQATVKNLSNVSDQIELLKSRIKATLAQGGAKAVEAAIPLIETASEVIGNILEKLSELDASQIKTIATLGLVAASVSPILKLVSGIASGISGLMTVLPGLLALFAANPLGATAIAVGAIATGLYGLSQITKDTTTYLDDLTKEASSFREEADKLKQTYDNTTKSYDSNYAAAKKILDRMRELESKNVTLGEHQAEYNALVAELNQLYPDLNAQINEHTGKVEGGTLAIEDQIDALHQLYVTQALQDYYTQMLEKYGQVQLEVYKNEALLAEAKETERQASEDLAAANAALAEVNERENEALAAGAEAWNAWVAEQKEAELAVAEADAALQRAQGNVNALTSAVARGKATLSGYDQQISDMASAVSAATSSMYSDGKQGGENFGQGLIDGLLAKKKRANEAAYALVDSIKRTSYTALDEHSPSKVAEAMGRYWSEGMAIGIEEGRKAVADAAVMLTQPMTQPIPSNTVNNTSNLGGVFVTVNAAQGQDVQQIAEAVMEEIQAAVEREGAAL